MSDRAKKIEDVARKVACWFGRRSPDDAFERDIDALRDALNAPEPDPPASLEALADALCLQYQNGRRNEGEPNGWASVTRYVHSLLAAACARTAEEAWRLASRDLCGESRGVEDAIAAGLHPLRLKVYKEREAFTLAASNYMRSGEHGEACDMSAAWDQLVAAESAQEDPRLNWLDKDTDDAIADDSAQEGAE